MIKRVSFCIITGFVISLPMLGIWVQSTRNVLQSPSEIPAKTTSTVNSVLQAASNKATNERIKNNKQNLEFILKETSLAETDPPEAFEVIDGIVQKTENLRSIFEYFLSLDGELSLTDIKNALRTYALESLPTYQAKQVIQAFEQYHDLLSEMSTRQTLLNAQDSLPEKLQWIKDNRREILGDELAEAYFGYDESYDDYQLRKLDITNDSNLSGSEKYQALAILSKELPEALRDREAGDNKIKKALIEDQQWQYERSEDELYTTRLEKHGFETTQRLTNLDHQRNEWEGRYSNYKTEVNSISASSLSQQDKQHAIERLRENHFSDIEILRVTTLDEHYQSNH